MQKRKPDHHVSRTVNDRRVRRIMAAVARVTASPHIRNRRSGLLDTAFETIITFGKDTGSFDGDNWSPEAVHAITLAIALNAPSRVLDQFVAAAEQAREFVEHWDERGWIEAETLPGDPRRWWEQEAKHAAKVAA